MTALRWEPVPYGRGGTECFVDVPGVGRYLIKRLGKNSREFRAYLNGRGTPLIAGKDAGGMDRVKRMVQEQVDAIGRGELNRAGVSTTSSPLPVAADLTRHVRVLLEAGAPPWAQSIEQRDDHTLCVLTEGRVFEVTVR